MEPDPPLVPRASTAARPTRTAALLAGAAAAAALAVLAYLAAVAFGVEQPASWDAAGATYYYPENPGAAVVMPVALSLSAFSALASLSLMVVAAARMLRRPRSRADELATD